MSVLVDTWECKCGGTFRLLWENRFRRDDVCAKCGTKRTTWNLRPWKKKEPTAPIHEQRIAKSDARRVRRASRRLAIQQGRNDA